MKNYSPFLSIFEIQRGKTKKNIIINNVFFSLSDKNDVKANGHDLIMKLIMKSECRMLKPYIFISQTKIHHNANIRDIKKLT